MKKKVDIYVDSSTWKGKKAPLSLTSLTGKKDINIFNVMLHIALRSAAPISHGFALGDLWAWLRYFPAISSNNGLRLKPEWEEIDSHQKVILSDDFGVGFSSSILWDALDFRAIIPVNYLINHSSFTLGSSSGKRGPKKSPDFIGIDKSSKCHVFECKGTQTNINAMEKQFETGREQKKNLKDPKGFIQERLVTGLFIPKNSSKEKSLFRIEDPELDIDLSDISKEELIKTVLRGNIASDFHLLGLPKLANSIALNNELSEENKKRIIEEVEKLEDNFINGKEYKIRRIQHNIDVREEDKSNWYGIEIKFGIEKNLLEKVVYNSLISEYINTVYDNFYELPPVFREEIESGINIITPLGLYAEMNILK